MSIQITIINIIAEAHHVLTKEGGPLHYDVLFARLVEAVGVPDTFESKCKVYNDIYNNIRRNGEHAAFRRVARATFVASENFDPETMALVKSNKTTAHPSDKPREYKVGPKYCGNCKHIEFNGIDQLRLERGTCALYNQSDRLAVRCAESACPLWQHRGDAQRASDRQQQKILMIKVRAVNLNAQRESDRARRR